MNAVPSEAHESPAHRDQLSGEGLACLSIPGLGKLVKAERAALIGRNPATAEALKIKTTVKSQLIEFAKDTVVPAKAWPG